MKKRERIRIVPSAVFSIIILVLIFIGINAWRHRSVFVGKDSAQILQSENIPYQVLTTFDYMRGSPFDRERDIWGLGETDEGIFSSISSGVLLIRRQKTVSDKSVFTYSFDASTHSHAGEEYAQTIFPPTSVVEDTAKKRLIAGNRQLLNFAAVANSSLSQISGPAPSSISDTMRYFRFQNVPEGFPREIDYTLNAARGILDTGQSVVISVAVSYEIDYRMPGQPDIPIIGWHSVLTVMTLDMNDLFFMCNRFIGFNRDSQDWFISDKMMLRMDNSGNPVSLKGLGEQFDAFYEKLIREKPQTGLMSRDAPPLWAMHSIAVQDMSALAGAAAIEGKPNFAITATIGLVLLADTGVSVGTQLLHEAGIISWEWNGIPNYVGQHAGLGAARTFANLSGADINEELWQDIGGVAGDIAVMFLPSQVLSTTFKISGTGIRVLKSHELAGKAIHLSSQGMKLVKAGKGWINSIEAYRSMQALQDVLDIVRLSMDLAELEEKYGMVQSVNSRISVLVKDATTRQPLPFVQMSVRRNGMVYATGATDSQGICSISLAPGDAYDIVFSKQGYVPENYYDITVESGHTTYLEPVLQISNRYAGRGSISGTIVNALDGNAVGGLNLSLRKSINARTGSIIFGTTTRHDGSYRFANINAGNYTIQATGAGYNTTFFTVVCIGNTETPGQNATVTPLLLSEQLRIILTWDSLPKDLDSHLTGLASNGERFHVYYQKKTVAAQGQIFAELDRDDTDSYGPETITVQANSIKTGKFSVHDFSNREKNFSSALSDSGAQVRVYQGNSLVRTFNVPPPPDNRGTLWKVFEIHGGDIIPLNTMHHQSNPAHIN